MLLAHVHRTVMLEVDNIRNAIGLFKLFCDTTIYYIFFTWCRPYQDVLNFTADFK